MFVELLLVAGLLIAYCVIKDRKPPNMPPGPWEIPFIGQIPKLGVKNLLEMRKQYGDIVTIRNGALRIVQIYDYKMAKDALSLPELTHRPSYHLDLMIDEQKTGGVALSNGEHWEHDRRFMLRNLRNFGLGKSYLDVAVNDEALALVEDLKKYNSEPVVFPVSLRTVTVNVLWQMMAGRRYDLNSHEVKALFEAIEEVFETNLIMLLIKTWFPICRKVPDFVWRLFTKADTTHRALNIVNDVITKVINEHEETFNPDATRDLIDEYLFEMKKAQEKGDDHLFRIGALKQIIADAFTAGSDTVTMGLRCIVHLLALYPDVARRLQEQVDAAVARDQTVSAQDKYKLPLVESFVNEMFRYSCFVITTFERMASKDTVVGGYLIPKGTVVKTVAYAIHHDSKYFKDPEVFKVDRFLDSDGKFQTPKEGIIFFGAGRRSCPGETLARTELFLYTVAILQHIDVVVPDGVVLQSEYHETQIGTLSPVDQKLIYRPRV